MYFTKPVKNSF